jgi:hypothetical protein
LIIDFGTGMLLSIFLSFVLARKFKGRKYAIFVFVVIVLVSFFSAFGWITIHQYKAFPFKSTEYSRLHPVPLSYPFYASVFYDLGVLLRSPIDAIRIIYQIDFLAFEMTRATTPYSSFTLGRAPVYYSLFLLINILGALVGYWMRQSRIVAYTNRAIAWVHGETLIFLSVLWALGGYFFSWVIRSTYWGSRFYEFSAEIYVVRFLIPCLIVLFLLALFQNGRKAYKQLWNVIRLNKVGAILGLTWSVCALTLPFIIFNVRLYIGELPTIFFDSKYFIFLPVWLPPVIACEIMYSLKLLNNMILLFLIVYPVSVFTSVFISTTATASIENLIKRALKRQKSQRKTLGQTKIIS